MNEVERQRQLILDALTSNLSNVVSMPDGVANRLRMDGFQPDWAIRLVREWARQGGQIELAQPDGENSRIAFENLFDTVVPVAHLPYGMYFKMGLWQGDEALIVSCHEANRPQRLA